MIPPPKRKSPPRRRNRAGRDWQSGAKGNGQTSLFPNGQILPFPGEKRKREKPLPILAGVLRFKEMRISLTELANLARKPGEEEATERLIDNLANQAALEGVAQGREVKP